MTPRLEHAIVQHAPNCERVHHGWPKAAHAVTGVILHTSFSCGGAQSNSRTHLQWRQSVTLIAHLVHARLGHVGAASKGWRHHCCRWFQQGHRGLPSHQVAYHQSTRRGIDTGTRGRRGGSIRNSLACSILGTQSAVTRQPSLALLTAGRRHAELAERCCVKP